MKNYLSKYSPLQFSSILILISLLTFFITENTISLLILAAIIIFIFSTISEKGHLIGLILFGLIEAGRIVFEVIGVSALINEMLFLVTITIILNYFKKSIKSEGEREKTYEELINNAMDGIIIINSSHKVVLFNKTAEQMFKVDAEEVINTDVHQFLPESFRQNHKELVNKFGKTGITNRRMGSLGILKAYRKDGVEFPIEASISHSNIGGEKIFSVNLRDVSERIKDEEKLKNMVNEKNLLIKEVHHRVKNNLQIIISLLNLQTNYIKNPMLLGALIESQNRIKSMSLIHEKLYKKQDSESLDIKNYIEDLSYRLFSTYRQNNSDVKFISEIEDVQIEPEKMVYLGLVLNEMITNSLKYAFPPKWNRNNVEKQIKITVTKKVNFVEINVIDNGIGFPDGYDFNKTDTLGMQLIYNLSEQIDGKIEVNTEEGVHFKLLLK